MPDAPATTLVLPTSKGDVSRRWIDQRFVMIGPAGVGKSGFWANGEKTFFIDAEGGLDHLKTMDLRTTKWQEFRDIFAALYKSSQNGGFPYDTIVIDTADALLTQAEQECITKACEKFQAVVKAGKLSEKSTIGDIPEGLGWNWCSKLLMTSLENLALLPAATVLIVHPKHTKVKPASGDEYDKETVALWGQLGGKVLGWSHHNLHLQTTFAGGTLKRFVRTLPQRGLEAKSHGGLIKDLWEWQSRDLAAEHIELRSWFT